MALVTGTSGYLTRSGGHPATSTAMTIIGGAKLTTDRNAAQTLMFLHNSGITRYVVLQTTADGTSLQLTPDGSGSASASVALSVGTSFMWAMKCSGTGAGLYSLHYRAIGSATTTKNTGTHGSTAWTPATMMLGDTSFSESFAGEIGPVWVYNEALSDAQIDQQFSKIVPIKTDTLRGWWPANSITLADMYIDLSEQKANLSAVNTVTAADNPPLSWGASPIIVPFVAAAAGTAVPVFVHNLRQQGIA